MKRIFSAFDRLAVHHARNLLEASGIRAEVRNEVLASAMGELPPAECQAEVWVAEQDAERAAAALRQPPPSGPDWHCARCGERSGAQFSACWNCLEARTPEAG